MGCCWEGARQRYLGPRCLPEPGLPGLANVLLTEASARPTLMKLLGPRTLTGPLQEMWTLVRSGRQGAEGSAWPFGFLPIPSLTDDSLGLFALETPPQYLTHQWGLHPRAPYGRPTFRPSCPQVPRSRPPTSSHIAWGRRGGIIRAGVVGRPPALLHPFQALTVLASALTPTLQTSSPDKGPSSFSPCSSGC